MEEMQAEAANLRRLQHPNLIQLYGVVEQPAMMVLFLLILQGFHTFLGVFMCF